MGEELETNERHTDRHRDRKNRSPRTLLLNFLESPATINVLKIGDEEKKKKGFKK